MTTVEFSEAHVFKVFQDLAGAAAKGDVVFTDKPDVLVLAPGCTVGYEITQLYHKASDGVPVVRQFGQRDTILKKAKALSIPFDIPPLYVIVDFASDHIPKCDWEGVASALARVISSNVPSPGGFTSLENDYYSGRMPLAIQAIDILRLPATSEHHWTHSGGGFVQREVVEAVQGAIDKKAALLASYLRRCDECSLIISAGGLPGVSFILPSPESLDHVYRSPFKVTYFVNILDRNLAQLLTR